MFSTTESKGFHITFENGWTVSVQFGRGNYCENYNFEEYGSAPPSQNAEIAAWGPNGECHYFDNGDNVMGYQSPEQVLSFMNKVSSK